MVEEALEAPACKRGEPNAFSMTGVDYGSAPVDVRRKNSSNCARTDSSSSETKIKLAKPRT